MRMNKHWWARNQVKCVLVERNVYPRTDVSVGNDCDRVGLEQRGHHHYHLIECNSYPEIMGSLLICISKMAVSSSQKFLQRFRKEIFCSGMRAFFEVKYLT